MKMEPGQNQAVEIATVVFFDLEATELASEGAKPRITELCMTAVQRAELNSNASPRVVNQLQLCFNPQKPIPPLVSSVTGLYNDILEGQAAFSAKTCQTVQAFLDHLSPPVCLVAHNGDHFDFPLLLAEFSRCQAQAPPQLLCADSLKAFKDLDACRQSPGTPAIAVSVLAKVGGDEENEKKPTMNGAEETGGSAQAQNEATPKVKRRRGTECPSSLTKSKPGSDGDFSNKVHRRKLDFDAPPNKGESDASSPTNSMPPGDSAGLDQPRKGKRQKRDEQLTGDGKRWEGAAAAADDDSSHGDLSKGENSPPPTDTTAAERYTLYSEKTEEYDLSFLSGGNQKAEHSGDLSSGGEKQNQETPSEASRLTSKTSLTDEDLLQAVTELEAKVAAPACAPHSTAHSRQKKRVGAAQAPVQRKQKVSYKQTEIYRRLFGCLPPDAHYASADTVALMKCAHKYCPDFLRWLDRSAVPLDSHRPLY